VTSLFPVVPKSEVEPPVVAAFPEEAAGPSLVPEEAVELDETLGLAVVLEVVPPLPPVTPPSRLHSPTTQLSMASHGTQATPSSPQVLLEDAWQVSVESQQPEQLPGPHFEPQAAKAVNAVNARANLKTEGRVMDPSGSSPSYLRQARVIRVGESRPASPQTPPEG
jgi:hypothetical protein